MIIEIETGRYFISKGTLIPYMCPECSKLVPFSLDEFVTCVMCGYAGCKEEFEVEWQAVKSC